jgi:hypothetical protein
VTAESLIPGQRDKRGAAMSTRWVVAHRMILHPQDDGSVKSCPPDRGSELEELRSEPFFVLVVSLKQLPTEFHTFISYGKFKAVTRAAISS